MLIYFEYLIFLLREIFIELYTILNEFLPFKFLFILLVAVVSILAFFRVVGD